jgi:hypothetical protein
VIEHALDRSDLPSEGDQFIGAGHGSALCLHLRLPDCASDAGGHCGGERQDDPDGYDARHARWASRERGLAGALSVPLTEAATGSALRCWPQSSAGSRLLDQVWEYAPAQPPRVMQTLTLALLTP